MISYELLISNICEGKKQLRKEEVEGLIPHADYQRLLRHSIEANKNTVLSKQLTLDIEHELLILGKTYPGLEEALAKRKLHQEGQGSQNGHYTPTAQERHAIPPLPAPLTCLPAPSPFLAIYQEHSKLLAPDVPDSWHRSCALWLLSVIAAGRLHYHERGNHMTPLTFVLVGESGSGKSTVARIARDILTWCGLDYLLGPSKTSPQKMVWDMAGNVPSNYEHMREDHRTHVRLRLALPNSRGWYIDELAELYRAITRPGNDEKFEETLLTFDNGERYTASYFSRGDLIIDHPYLALLACAVPSLLARAMRSASHLWTIGMWGRMLWDYHPTVALSQEDYLGHVEQPTTLIDQLIDFHDRLGIPAVSIDHIQRTARDSGRYVVQQEEPLIPTYVIIDEQVKAASAAYKYACKQLALTVPVELRANYHRLHPFVFRVASLLSGIDNRFHVTLPIWASAQSIVEEYRTSLHIMYEQLTNDIAEERARHNPAPTYSEMEQAILTCLDKSPCTIRDMRRLGPYKLQKATALDIKRYLDDLMSENIVKIEKVGQRQVYARIQNQVS